MAGPQDPPVRRFLTIALILSIVLGVLLGGHYYLLSRLVWAPALPAPVSTALTILIIGLGISLVLLFAAERFLPPPWTRLVTLPATLWMGFAWFAGVILGLSDLALLLAGAAGSADVLGLRAALVTGLVALVMLVTVPRALRPPAVRRVEVSLRRWPKALDGYRIAQLSDIHIGPILGRGFAASLTQRVNDLGADLVVITGDLVDGPVALFGKEAAPLGDLRARDGVYLVTGNHDHYSNADPWIAHFESLGLVALRNRHLSIGRDGASFDLAGVEDHQAARVSAHWREDVEGALAGRDGSRPVILLAHDPTTFRRASRQGVDLQLSGHTHGGQIWPFGFLVRLAVPWLAGLYRVGESALYVSRGTGFWGPPMRVGAPAEITELVLRAPTAVAESR